jgi:tetratricopeptide (TPR) repeat protein
MDPTFVLGMVILFLVLVMLLVFYLLKRDYDSDRNPPDPQWNRDKPWEELKPAQGSKSRTKKFFTFSSDEINDLILAWIMLATAFGILYSDFSVETMLTAFPMCFVTVGLGLILHEVGHKFLAQHYGFEATFRANYSSLFISILLSFAGFVLVNPGAVWFRGNVSKKQNGLISMVGPLINALLGICFLAAYLTLSFDSSILMFAVWLGYKINVWIGLFNLIPIPPFDGEKIIQWNKIVYGSLVAITLGLYLLSYTNIAESPYKKAHDLNLEGNEFYAAEDYSSALAKYNEALKSDPSSAVILSNKADSLRELGSYEESLIYYDKSLSINSKDAGIWKDKAKSLYYLEEYDSALYAINRSLDLNFTSNAWHWKGGILMKSGRYQEAIDSLEKALNTDPLNPSLWELKAEALKELGRINESKEAADKAEELSLD